MARHHLPHARVSYTVAWEPKEGDFMYLCYNGSTYWWMVEPPPHTLAFTENLVRHMLDNCGRKLQGAPVEEVRIVQIMQKLEAKTV